MPDGELLGPGGWNRIQIEVKNIEATVKELKSKRAKFRDEIVTDVGGKQILLEDPSGNLIELFQPAPAGSIMPIPISSVIIYKRHSQL